MPTINIDGKEYEFEGKPRLLQWCLDNGIEIPYFCYHPAMSTPTNCRMCLIELGFHAKDRATGELQFDEEGDPVINWGRKPATSCNTMMGPGMFVRTHRSSADIKEAQQGVLEYLLINHPLDCPICDQAGECPLQIWTYKYGPEGSRFEVQKVHKPKRVALGPRVVMDAERCINCTRCTRFTQEVSGSHQLTIINRGDKNLPATAPGQVFDDEYSMNTVDICPVGALTSREHRFKARVWEMAYAEGIDMHDSTGTNIYIWVRDNEVMRVTPRKNLEINDYWIPDAYRIDTDYYNERRVSGTRVKGDIPVAFNKAVDRAATLLDEHRGATLFLGSAYASLESNFMLRELARSQGVERVYYVSHIDEDHADNWLKQADRTPNAAACELLGFEALSLDEAKQKIAGASGLLYSLENTRLFDHLDAELDGLQSVVHASHHAPCFDQRADVLLPAALSIEAEGVYVNKDQIPQVSRLARQIQQMTPDMWMRLPKSRLDKGGVPVDRWRDIDNILDVLPSWLLIARIGRNLGLDMPFETHQEIYPVVQQQFFDLLSELTVSYIPPKQAFKFTQLEYAPKW